MKVAEERLYYPSRMMIRSPANLFDMKISLPWWIYFAMRNEYEDKNSLLMACP
jgi:hypothetical protein